MSGRRNTRKNKKNQKIDQAGISNLQQGEPSASTGNQSELQSTSRRGKRRTPSHRMTHHRAFGNSSVAERTQPQPIPASRCTRSQSSQSITIDNPEDDLPDSPMPKQRLSPAATSVHSQAASTARVLAPHSGSDMLPSNVNDDAIDEETLQLIALKRHWYALPNEIAAMILGWVINVRSKLRVQTVCRQWRHLIMKNRLAWHGTTRLLLRHGMDSNPRHPQWVLNGIRFHHFMQLRPLLNQILKMSPISSLIMQVFTSGSSTKIHRFKALIDMVLRHEFDRALTHCTSLELAFMGQLEQKNLKLVKTLIESCQMTVRDLHINTSVHDIISMREDIEDMWDVLRHCHRIRSIQSDSVPIDPERAIMRQPLTTLVVPLTVGDAFDNAQSLSRAINSSTRRLQCLTINGPRTNTPAIHMERFLYSLHPDAVADVTELFINCLVADSPDAWLPKLARKFRGVTHVRIKKQLFHTNPFTIVQMCQEFDWQARHVEKERRIERQKLIAKNMPVPDEDFNTCFRNITCALYAPLPNTAKMLVDGFDNARVNRRVIEHNPWAGWTNCVVKITTGACRLKLPLNMHNPAGTDQLLPMIQMLNQ